MSVHVHPTAVVDEGAEIGAGTRVWHFCHVQTGAVIGRDCVLGQNVYVAPNSRIGDGVHIQNNVSVYGGVTVEDFVFLGPSMVFTNVRTPRVGYPRRDEYAPTLVCAGASIGANATIVCGVTIGSYATVGAGAVVTHDVVPHALMLGVPARRAGWMCRCGDRLDFGDESRATCGRCDDRYEVSGEHIERL